jgi:hypothetical protein
MSGTDTQSEDVAKLDEEVRGYFKECEPFSIRKILDKIQGAEVALVASTETIRKRYRDRDVQLGGLEDLSSLKAFFTSHPHGLRLRGIGASLRSQQIATPPELALIGPGERVRPVAPTELASITIAGNRWGQGTVSVKISLFCGIIHGFALQRGIISLDPHPGAMTSSHRAAWGADRTHNCKIEGRDSTIVLRCYKSEWNPVWQIDGQGQPIGDWNYPDFADLEGLSPGDTVTVRFSAWWQDMVSDDPAREFANFASDNADTNENLSVSAEGSLSPELHAFTRLVDAMLRQDKLVSMTGGGRVELSRDVLKIKEANNEKNRR